MIDKKKLIDEAASNGMCDIGLGRIKKEDAEGIIENYLESPDWCMKRGFPDLDTIRNIIDGQKFSGIFVDREFTGEMLNEFPVYIFHNCRGTIRVGINIDKKLIPVLYVANGCRLKIIGSGEIVPIIPSIVPVFAFGNNRITVESNKFVNIQLRTYELGDPNN